MVYHGVWSVKVYGVLMCINIFMFDTIVLCDQVFGHYFFKLFWYLPRPRFLGTTDLPELWLLKLICLQASAFWDSFA